MLTHCLAKETIFWDLKALIHLKNVEADGEPLYGTTTDGVTYNDPRPLADQHSYVEDTWLSIALKLSTDIHNEPHAGADLGPAKSQKHRLRSCDLEMIYQMGTLGFDVQPLNFLLNRLKLVWET